MEEGGGQEHGWGGGKEAVVSEGRERVWEGGGGKGYLRVLGDERECE